MKRIGIIDQTFRDGPQSLWASRITTGMMLPIAEKMDQIGFDYMDVGAAGAIADVAVRHLKENPWERTRLLRDRKSTRLNSSHSQQSRMPSSA